MIPSEFLVFAKSLQADSSAAAQRSATSRAYYSAFLEAVSLLSAHGLTVSKTERDSHRVIADALANTNDSTISIAGEDLKALKSRRRKADYEISDLEPEKPAYVKKSVELAIGIVSSLEALAKDRTRLGGAVSSITSWNANAKKLNVRS